MADDPELDPDTYLTTTAIAALLGVTAAHAWSLGRDGRFGPGCRLAGSKAIRYSLDGVEDYLGRKLNRDQIVAAMEVRRSVSKPARLYTKAQVFRVAEEAIARTTAGLKKPPNEHAWARERREELEDLLSKVLTSVDEVLTEP